MYYAILALCVALALIPTLFLHGLFERLDLPNGPVSILVASAAFAGVIGGDLLLRRLGLSLSGRAVEGRRPAAVGRDEFQPEEVVVLRLPWSGRVIRLLGVALLLPGVALICWVTMSGRWTGDPALWVMTVVGPLFLIGMAGQAFRATRLDDAEVSGPMGMFGPRRQVVPWTAVATCDLVADRDPFGKVSVYPVLKDARGYELAAGLKGLLIRMPAADRDRAFKVLKRRFPKLDWDPYEL